MSKQTFCFIAATILISSCSRISFLHPISTDNDEKIVKTELVGQWSAMEGEPREQITITTVDDDRLGNIYKIEMRASERGFADSNYLNGELFELKGKLFLMVSTDIEHKSVKNIGIINAATVLQTYYVVRIYSISHHEIVIGNLIGDHVEDLINAKKFDIKHEIVQEGDVVILEKPAGIKKKLIELEKFPEVYKKKTYRRVN